jgi:hypothetical protein
MSGLCMDCKHYDRPIDGTECDPCLSTVNHIHFIPKMANIPNSDKTIATEIIGAVAGRKDDGGKLDVTLVLDDMPHAIEAVAEVCQWAITKKQPKPYERGSWQFVEDFQRRYRAAMNRHQLNKAKAHIQQDDELVSYTEPRDAETGLMELAHIATDAMFMLEMAVRKSKGLQTPSGA